MRAVAIACLLFATLAAAKEPYATQWLSGIRVPTVTPNVTLSMDCEIAKSDTYGERFPVLVFANSWGVPQIEYITALKFFAAKGYIVCEYETRGWWFSGGEIGTAGSLDQEDTTSVINYIIDQQNDWQLMPDSFAFLGISYGAGMSLMAAGKNPKVVKTAVAMSGWGKLNEGFYYHDSPSHHELQGLLKAAETVGRPQESLKEFYTYITEHKNQTALWDFIHSRSPELVALPTINKNKIPIFLSNNINDQFFFPQAKAEFYNKITSEKFQLINKGQHAIPEALGLINLAVGSILNETNYIWMQVEKWIDYQMKGIETGITKEKAVQVEHGLLGVLSHNYLKLDNWGDSTIQSKQLLFNPPAPKNYFGTVEPLKKDIFGTPVYPKGTSPAMHYNPAQKLDWGWSDLLARDFGIPSPQLWGNTTWPSEDNPLNNATNVVFNGYPLADKNSSGSVPASYENGTMLCGIPNITLSLNVPKSRVWQFYGTQYASIGVQLTDIAGTSQLFSGILSFKIGTFQLTYWGDYSTPNTPGITIDEADIKPGPTADTETVIVRNIAAQMLCHDFFGFAAKIPIPHLGSVSLQAQLIEYGISFYMNNDYMTPSTTSTKTSASINYGKDSYINVPYVQNGQNVFNPDQSKKEVDTVVKAIEEIIEKIIKDLPHPNTTTVAPSLAPTSTPAPSTTPTPKPTKDGDL